MTIEVEEALKIKRHFSSHRMGMSMTGSRPASQTPRRFRYLSMAHLMRNLVIGQ